MPTKTSPRRLLQVAAVTIIGVFVLGFVSSPLGVWTGAVLGAWFIGTQKAWRGFLLLAGIKFILDLLSNWRGSRLIAIEYVGWTMLAVLISALPFLLYRLTSQRRPGFLSTLSLPVWGVVFQTLGHTFLPAGISHLATLAQTQSAISPLPRIAAILGTGAISFLIYWFAAVVLWMWNQEFRAKRIAAGASIFGAACLLVLGYGFFLQTHPAESHVLVTSPLFAWICFGGGLVLGAWSLVQPGPRREVWANKAGTVALLRSPDTGDPLRVVSEDGQEALVSPSGERFPVRNGIPVFAEPEKLTGSNHKYNRLYEIIGGFYDDIQRVACALRGVSLEEYLWSYLRFLEIHPGDSVLETSVGTGLNIRYLPRGARLFGLDLSAEMLTNCQANLRRWDMEADLFLGNAEDLPFANDSFDVVFHAGGINFFNDRAKAIREMIRVAKPGSRMLIADETEEHVKGIYERSPGVGKFFKNRKGPVTAPVELVPPEMREIHLEILRNGRFYALTFRKPPAALNPMNTRSSG